jgi:hypothetical protein
VQSLAGLLKEHDWQDPWLQCQLWTQYLEGLHDIGKLDDGHIQALLSERLPSAEPYRETALREGRQRPALSIRLMERAARIDPRLPFLPEQRQILEYFLAAQKRPPSPR